jgi:O-antigen/teichoic acid export membrane protein
VNRFSSFFSSWRQDRNFTRLLRNGASLFTSNTFVTVLQFVQVVILTRFLLPEGYGVFVLVTSFVMLVNQFFDVRVSETTIKFGAEYLVRGDELRAAAIIKLSYLVDLSTGVLAFVVVLVSGPWAAANILHDGSLAPLIALYALTLLISTADNTNSAVLRLFDRFQWMAVYSVVMGVFELAAVAVAIALGGGVREILVALLVKDGLSAVTNWALAAAALRGRMGLRAVLVAPRRALAGRYRELSVFLFHTNFMAYFRMVNTRVDVLLLGYFRPPAEVGLYKLARQIAALIGRLSDPFFSAILPDLSRLWAERRAADYRRLVGQSSLLMAAVLVPAGIVISLVPGIPINLVAGPNYGDAAPLLVVCAWGFVLAGIFFWIWPAALSMQRPDYGTTIGLFATAAQLLVALLLVPAWGALGNCLALLASYAIGQPLLAWLILRALARAERQSHLGDTVAVRTQG